MYNKSTSYQELTWDQFKEHLVLEESFEDNGGDFESYIIKDNIMLLVSVYDDEWSVINYVQLLPASEDGDACMVIQLEEAPEEPFNIKMDVVLKVRVFVEQ